MSNSVTLKESNDELSAIAAMIFEEGLGCCVRLVARINQLGKLPR